MTQGKMPYDVKQALAIVHDSNTDVTVRIKAVRLLQRHLEWTNWVHDPKVGDYVPAEILAARDSINDPKVDHYERLQAAKTLAEHPEYDPVTEAIMAEAEQQNKLPVVELACRFAAFKKA